MKTIYIFLIFVFIGGLLGCNKALDRAPDGKLTLEEVFNDPIKVSAFLNTCYANMPTKGARYFFWSRGPVVWSDEAWDTDAEAESGLMSGRMYNGNAAASNHPIPNTSADGGNGDYWARYFAAIRNCALFITRIDAAAVINESDRHRWKAEAHLLRAYYYSELLKWYGAALPIIREAHNYDEDFSTLEKVSFYDLAKFIEEDCNIALSTDELPWRITGNEGGRVNKAMAEAIKSKMLLFAASPLFNNGQNYWDEAYEVNKASLQSLRDHGFELYHKVNFPQTYLSDNAYIGPNKDEKAALYNEYFTQVMAYSDNPVDKETLYQSRENQGNIWNIDGIGAQDGYKTGTCPSQEIVDAYETTNGEPILDLDKPYLDEKHLQPNYNPANDLYDPKNPYANRDPRFYASIYYNGSKRKALWNFAETKGSPENYPAPMGNRTRIIATYVGEPKTGIDEAESRTATRTGYFGRKFLHPNSGNDLPVAGANWKLFRLGEVILNFAEAAAESGHLDEAASAVNEIRSRVGMPNIPAGLTQQQMITRVRHERQVELAFEENRYFDVRRWTAPDGNLAATDKWITAANIIRNADGSYTYGRKTVRAGERRNYTNAYLLVPIPLAEANRLLSITGINWQNPGW